MEDERDLVVFSDDEGNEFTMEVLDYFGYEGKEYAILTEAQEACEGCGNSCEGCESKGDTYVMEVKPVEGTDEEEFLPIDEALEERLIALIENGLYDTDDEFVDEEDDIGEEDE